MRVKPLIVGLSLSCAFALTYSTIFNANSATQIRELKSEISRRQGDNQRLSNEIAELKAKLNAISQRPEVRERMVRDELGWIRADEVKFNFEGEP